MSDESGVDVQHSQQRRKLGFFLILLAFMLVIAGFAYGYLQLMKINTSLAQMVNRLESSRNDDHQSISNIQNTLNELRASDIKTQEINQKQQQLINEWQAAQNGDLNKWHLAEAQYFVKLANDHLQFSQNIPLAIQLLQRAQSEITPLQGAGLAELRSSTAQAIITLQALPQLDISANYKLLSDISNQIDQLPLPLTPLKNDDVTTPVAPPTQKWWQAGWERTKTALQKIVIVRRIGPNNVPVVLPDEKAFLYQNLHAQVESAMWGLLHRNNTVYQASLERMQKWINQYFVQDADITKSIQQKLSELVKVDVQKQPADISATVNSFNAVMTSLNASGTSTTNASESETTSATPATSTETTVAPMP